MLRIVCVYIQVPVRGLQPRCDHCAAAFSLCPGLTEVALFGGCPKWPKNAMTDADFPCVADTTMLRLGECYGMCTLLHGERVEKSHLNNTELLL